MDRVTAIPDIIVASFPAESNIQFVENPPNVCKWTPQKNNAAVPAMRRVKGRLFCLRLVTLGKSAEFTRSKAGKVMEYGASGSWNSPPDASKISCQLREDVTFLSVHRARRLLRVHSGPRPQQRLQGAPETQMKKASSKTCGSSADRRIPSTYAPHSPTRITKNLILKLAGAFQ